MVIAKPKKTIMMLFGTKGKCSVLINPKQRWTVVEIKDGMVYLSRNNISIKISQKDFDEHWRMCDGDL